jgi:dTDP-4-dehydrorhamnose reductase
MAIIGVFGSTGMLGSHVSDLLSKSNHEVIEFNRKKIPHVITNEVHLINASNNSWVNDLNQISKKPDYIINCIGKIKHKINEKNEKDLIEAINVNAVFSLDLATYCDKNEIQLIQVFTDCVYAGDAGKYNEESKKSPTDIYGYTKAIGESLSYLSMNIRTSFIGLEIETHLELMSWLLSKKFEERVLGFNNHIWNGVTALQISKIILSIIDKDSFVSGIFHLLPSDTVNKFELLKLIQFYSQRNDFEIESFKSDLPVNRTLTTLNPAFNLKLWQQAGYASIPSIAECVEEYFAQGYGMI